MLPTVGAGFTSPNNEIYYFVVDFFNDLTGMNRYADKMWDLQSKGDKNPSPNTNASTHSCAEIPKASAIGTINGISKNAFAEPDGIKKFKNSTNP